MKSKNLVRGIPISVSCSTFGSPPVGEENFVRLFNSEIQSSNSKSNRFAIVKDPVPSVMVNTPGSLYRHVKNLVELKYWRPSFVQKLAFSLYYC